MSLSFRAGQKEGYRTGYSEGYRLGGCRALMERIPAEPLPFFDLKILYVPQGFEAIDEGVAKGLSRIVRECIIAPPANMMEVALQQLPDIILVMNGLHVFPEDFRGVVDQLRTNGFLMAIWFVDDPYFTEETPELAQHFDVVFTHELSCVPVYQAVGVKQVYYLPLGVHPELFTPTMAGPAYHSDICFIGNAFRNRAALFDEMAPFLKGKQVRIIGGFWDRLARYKELSPFVYGGFIPPAETVKFYNGAKIVINLHRPTESGDDNRNSLNLPGRSINPRTFEINACGTLQITDIREDLCQYYTPGTDIETYGSVSELKHKISYYLAHEDERRRIAQRALETTLTRHTYVHRLPELLRLIQENRWGLQADSGQTTGRGEEDA